MLPEQKNKDQLKPNKRRIKLLLISFILVIFIFILATACNTTEPPPKIEGTISLTAEDASSTEAWLNVKLQNVNLPAELKLFREDSVTRIFNPSISDTLLYEEGLLPNKTYTYKVTIQAPNKTTIQSKAVTLTTMDTTSHNFTWQTYTFGGANGSSTLNDVAIINENNIWAVGEIHTAETDQFDSNGVWVDPYNAVHWDGNTWELKRINGHGSPTSIILAFNQNDIWFDGLLHWDGNSYSLHSKNFPLEPNGDGWRMNATWGTSSSDFYVVGNNGNIAHYNGSGWTKIESGTEINLNDIYGYDNAIYFLASELFSGIDSKLYKVENNTSVLQADLDLGRESLSLWLFKKQLYITGGRTFEKTEGKSGLKEITNSVGSAGFYKIRGTNYNNIIIVGSSYEAVHFNGKTWRENEITVNDGKNGIFTSVSIVSNVICAVGREYGGNTAVIAIGRK